MRRRLALGLPIAIALATSVTAARQPVRARNGMVVAMESNAVFTVSYALAEGLKRSRDLGTDPESKRVFQRDGQYFAMGDTITQPDLARTLERIATHGPNQFYEGDTATRLAAEMAKHGGLITASDLKSYKAIERRPLQGTYRNYTVITAPPSSSGGITLLEMLGMLEGTGYERGGAGAASAIHYGAEAMRRASARSRR